MSFVPDIDLEEELEPVQGNSLLPPIVSSDDDENERDELLEKLKVCFPPSIVQLEVVRWSNLPIEDLRSMVELTIASTGGSFDVAQTIRSLENMYVDVTQTEIFKRKLGILEQRGADYTKIVQRLERIAGSDFVLQHLKVEEFMNLCKALTYNIEAVHSVILKIAAEENLKLPPENAFSDDPYIPIVEGLPADPRIIGYVITCLHSQMKAYHGQVMALNDAFRKLQIERDYIKKELERSREECKAAHEAKKNLVPLRPTSGDPLYLIRVGGDKGKYYLSLVDPDAKPAFSNFDYEGTFETALILDSAEQARRYIDKFKAKKPKTLKKLGGMSIIEINFFVV